jgi:hypothetical protein
MITSYQGKYLTKFVQSKFFAGLAQVYFVRLSKARGFSKKQCQQIFRAASSSVQTDKKKLDTHNFWQIPVPELYVQVTWHKDLRVELIYC